MYISEFLVLLQNFCRTLAELLQNVCRTFGELLKCLQSFWNFWNILKFWNFCRTFAELLQNFWNFWIIWNFYNFCRSYLKFFQHLQNFCRILQLLKIFCRIFVELLELWDSQEFEFNKSWLSKDQCVGKCIKSIKLDKIRKTDEKKRTLRAFASVS